MSKYEYRTDDHVEEFEAADADEALEFAQEMMEECDYEDYTGPVYAYIYEGDNEIGRVEHVVQQQEPACREGEHDWRAPHSVVGGLKDNPGVFGKGGGVVYTEVCAHCGTYRVTDTWCTNGTAYPYESVTFRDADEYSTDWIETVCHQEEEERNG